VPYLGRIVNDQVFGPRGELVMTCLPNRVLATQDDTVYLATRGVPDQGGLRVAGPQGGARCTAVVLVLTALEAGFSRPMTELEPAREDERRVASLP
jgi:hypothetical protein